MRVRARRRWVNFFQKEGLVSPSDQVFRCRPNEPPASQPVGGAVPHSAAPPLRSLGAGSRNGELFGSEKEWAI